MKFIQKILTRSLVVLGFCFTLLVTFLLNPALLYSKSTSYNNITVYHNQPLATNMKTMVDASLAIVATSEIYDSDFHTNLCLNDGSCYPALVKTVLGDDVFRAFANKVIVLGEYSAQPNRFIKWGEQINFTQWLAHGIIHNLQYQHHGFRDANPLGGHPMWKWEGYAEYHSIGEEWSFEELLAIYENATGDDFQLVKLEDDYTTIKLHIKYLLMTKYCLEVLHLDYETFMNYEIEEQALLELVIREIQK